MAKIAAVIDHSGWAFEIRARNVISRAAEHEFTIIHSGNVGRNQNTRFDLIWCVGSPIGTLGRTFKKLMEANPAPFIFGVATGNIALEGKEEVFASTLRHPLCAGVHVQNKTAGQFINRTKGAL